MHKYGIRLPKPVKEAYELDEENKNNLRKKGTEEETEKIKATVAELTTSSDNLVRYQEIYLHMILISSLGKNSGAKQG